MSDFYYQQTHFVSNSDLGSLDRASKGDSISLEDKRYLNIGTLVDAILTQPEQLNYVTKSYTDWKGCVVFSHQEWDMAHAMAKSMRCDRIGNRMLNGCQFQKEIYIEEHKMILDGEQFSLPMRCMLDSLYMPMRMGADFKSTRLADPLNLQKLIERFNYDRAAALYMDLTGLDRFWLLFASKKFNPVTQQYPIFKWAIERDDAIYKQGKRKYTQLAHIYYHTIYQLNL